MKTMKISAKAAAAKAACRKRHVYMYHGASLTALFIGIIIIILKRLNPLKYSTSEAQQTQSFSQSYTGTGTNRHWRVKADNLWQETNFKQICFQYLTKSVYSFRRFNCNRELITTCWRSHRESRFANIQPRFTNKLLFGNGCSKGSKNIREM